MPPPIAGVPFGKYILLSKLAMGGMAELFLAKTKTGSDRTIVLKRVLPEYAEEREFLTMFLNEARIAAQLNHPNIIQIYDLGHESEQYFIAMEFIDGCDLSTAVKAAGGKVRPEIGARIGAQLCDALYYANTMVGSDGKSLDIIHRDVTPGNIMLAKGGGVKLVDFGIAKASVQFDRTRPGVVKGKFRYMSPEQLDEIPLDGRSDLFSLGVLLYEVTTGDKLFDSKQIIETLKAVKSLNPPPPHVLVPGFPKALSAIIMRALEKNRDKRYRTAKDMQLELETYLATTGPASDLTAFMRKLFPEERADPTPRKTGQIRKPLPDGTAPMNGDDVKRMVAEADKRAAARKAEQSPPPVDEPITRDMGPVVPPRKVTHEPPRRKTAAPSPGLSFDDKTSMEPSLSRAPVPGPPKSVITRPGPPTDDEDEATQHGGDTTGKVLPPIPRRPTRDQSSLDAPIRRPSRPQMKALAPEEEDEGATSTSSVTETAPGPSSSRRAPQGPGVAAPRSKKKKKASNTPLVIALGLALLVVVAVVAWIWHGRAAVPLEPQPPVEEVEVKPRSKPENKPRPEPAPDSTAVKPPAKEDPPPVEGAPEGKLTLQGHKAIRVLENAKELCAQLDCTVSLPEGDHTLTIIEGKRKSTTKIRVVAGSVQTKKLTMK